MMRAYLFQSVPWESWQAYTWHGALLGDATDLTLSRVAQNSKARHHVPLNPKPSTLNPKPRSIAMLDLNGSQTSPLKASTAIGGLSATVEKAHGGGSNT